MDDVPYWLKEKARQIGYNEIERNNERELIRVFLIAEIVIVLVFAGLILFKSKAFAEEVNMRYIAQIESSNNPSAYNPIAQATGMYQVTPCVLREYNQFHNTKYQMSNLFDEEVCLKVASWYMNKRIPSMLKHYKLADTIENRLISYNAGIGRCKKFIVPKETKAYIKRYKELKKSQ